MKLNDCIAQERVTGLIFFFFIRSLRFIIPEMGISGLGDMGRSVGYYIKGGIGIRFRRLCCDSYID